METPPVPQSAWRAWTPDELALRLAGAPAGWYVAGGWALDLWRGFQTRAHDDLEFVAPADGLAAFRAALAPMSFWTAHAGELRRLPFGEPPPSHVWQIWCLDEAAACWRVDLMIDRGTPSRWLYKRNPAISAPRGDMVRTTTAGIPYLAPAAALLFKAKYRRDKDETDFAMAAPHLAPDERAQLRAWLDMEHPGHPWRDALQLEHFRKSGARFRVENASNQGAGACRRKRSRACSL
ncbi:hypothetical protein GCM10019059_14310 [Camelimonas fluminis]|uniref:Nucleotidyltransferase domain-containing protein n=1 Tax=Camelimonas fluminis TaxID=1576911 RepID=A0ABV7UMD2_9HYPH|nr:amino acid transporter [Camelimonas fluminis]GHE56179.1 hypothetical protein GCM10019059_14310 [Camelimonas fluminis]